MPKEVLLLKSSLIFFEVLENVKSLPASPPSSFCRRESLIKAWRRVSWKQKRIQIPVKHLRWSVCKNS